MSNEAQNLQNANLTQQIEAQNKNMAAVVAEFNQLQATLVDTFNLTIQNVDLLPMRMHNYSASPSTPLQYPPGVVVVAGGALPITQSEALALTGPQYIPISCEYQILNI